MLGRSLRSVPEVTASWTSLRSGARTGPQAPRLTRRQGRNPALVEVPGRDAKSGRDSAHLTSPTLGVPATPLRHAIPCPRCQPLAMNQPRRGQPGNLPWVERSEWPGGCRLQRVCAFLRRAREEDPGACPSIFSGSSLPRSRTGSGRGREGSRRGERTRVERRRPRVADTPPHHLPQASPERSSEAPFQPCPLPGTDGPGTVEAWSSPRRLLAAGECHPLV